MDDVIVIGAGPAGLQAALTLGRMHRSVLLLDSGEYRNATVAHMHNVVTHDGTPPSQFRTVARAQLESYADVTVREATATAVSGAADDFSVTLDDGTTARARRVILATGVVDDLPDIPGLAELWGRRAFTCPFCDGHEHAGRQVALLGTARAAHLVALLGRIAAGITVFPLGESPSDEERRALETRGARVHAAPAAAVRADGDGVRVETAVGDVVVDGVFVATGSMRQRAPFAEQLGLRMLSSGAIEIDEFGRTSVAGVSAAGDLAHRATLPGPVASVVMAAAAGQMAAAGLVQELAAH
ncbi:NAD(P)/FAD-dependent oxidoreductase [Microbacterium sp. Marseille-Q6965]|uniref:NAD(P)/FAD-dependent oxidoreductase n=1 Tax=Microbacterium sp. Marseille-Q6965 TaxID=2965072 RepID=UPI0021B7B044|nr:NAD(P)/FAD-dependent oxidoreductase [Microbacterium sp. Marseille-Q6965]